MIATPLSLAVSLSLVLQVTAAFLALRLIRVTGRYRAWLLVVAALSFMTLRRVLVLKAILLPGGEDISVSLPEELVALVTSALMAAGIYLIRPLFLDLSNSREALRSAEERYRSIFEKSLDGILVTDRQGTVQDVNAAALDALGYRPHEVAGLHVDAFCHDSGQRRRFKQEMQAAGSLRDFEINMRRKDGGELLCEVSACVTHDRQGNVVGYQGIMRDVTARRQMEEALRLSEQKFAKVFNSSPVWIILSTLEEGILTDVNEAFLTATGYRREEVLGRTSLELGLWTDPSDRRRGLEEIERSGHLRNLEVGRRTKGGQELVMLWSAEVIDIGGEKVLLSTHQDITERQRADKAHRRSVENYRLLVDNANEAIFIAQDGVIKFPNPRTMLLTGYGQEELGRMPFLSLVHLQDQQYVGQLHQQVLAGQPVSESRSFRMTSKSGEERWLNASGVTITWEGRPAALSFVRDMTEHKHMEQQLLHAQKMEAIGRLAGGVAHDFNNLLTIIKGHGQLALRQVNGNHPLRDRLNRIMQAGDKGARLTRQLLSLSQVRGVEQGALDLNRLVVGMGELFRPLVPENVRLITVLGDGLWPVSGDPGQVEQVIMNLVVNALDAMPGGGELRIETRREDMDSGPAGRPMGLGPGPFAVLTVRDTGCGMDTQTQCHIFEPFYTTKGTGKGTGLGLSVAYGIVKQAGGGIAVHSEPRRGTTFRVYLPRAEASPQTARPAKVQERGSGGSETVLLVEDEEDLRSLLAESLRLDGYQVLEACRAEQALALVSAHQGPLHLAISDMVLPGMSGPRLMERLKRLRPEAKTLFISGYAEAMLGQTGMPQAGAMFLRKPFSMDELGSKMRQILG